MHSSRPRSSTRRERGASPATRASTYCAPPTTRERFSLYEVYVDEQAFRAHQQTAHYLAWKERVAPMMAASRVGVKYAAVFPEPWR